MTNLITFDNISLAYGLDTLLENAQFQIAAGERVCLIGRNGAGKSSLLKIVEGNLTPDSGTVWRKPHLRMARLAQELPQTTEQTVYEFVAEGLAETGKLLAEYHLLTHQLEHAHTDHDLHQLERLQREIDTKNGWAFEQNINTILERLELNPEAKVRDLSGGWQRRTALAQALVSSPELLLLDEPTNHLDIDAIQWLEDQLLAAGTAILFITHDRSLLQRLATRIIELDRGKLTSWPGDYKKFLQHKEEFLQAEANQQAEFDKKLAQEEKWIRQGIKARRTRNEGRVRALETLRKERSKRREVQGKVTFNLNEAEKSGQLVIEASHVSHHFSNQLIIDNLSLRIMRGDRIGLIGPNGIGKSTLLNILLGKLIPEKGTVKQGTKLQIAYFDQLRQALELEKTVFDNVANGREFIEINGQKRHAISYLGDFLFTPQRALTPVKALSGGECNRLLLARLFSLPANLLVLDEPTNDLDMETLELLEELLSDYPGTLLIVSHDRTFLDNVITSSLVFEGNGQINEYIGGYHDWQEQMKQAKSLVKNTSSSESETKKSRPKTTHKLSFKEQKELAELPLYLEKLENEQQELLQKIGSPEFYQQDSNTISATLTQSKELEVLLQTTYERWEELEKKL